MANIALYEYCLLLLFSRILLDWNATELAELKLKAASY